MSVILNFSDIGCLNESAAGSLGAGMASFVNAGIPAARGFVITPEAFTDYLGKGDIRAAMGFLTSGAESPEDGWRSLKALFARARMDWSHELEILSAFGELDSTVSVVSTSRYGANAQPVYASGGPDLLEAVKHCWLRWLRTGIGHLGDDMPAVVVREVLESEVSVEFRRKGRDIRARAVFGLPEGLHDSTVSSDIFEFKPDGTLERMEMRPQDNQYVMKDRGPFKVGISPDLRGEEKLSGDMIAGLREALDIMRNRPGMVSCTACFVSSRPVICSAELMSDSVSTAELPPRDGSITLLGSVKAPEPVRQEGPVVAAKLYLMVTGPDSMARAGDTYLDGILVTGDPLGASEGGPDLAEMAAEAKRRFRASSMVLELNDTGQASLERLADAVGAVSDAGMQPGVLVPGIRSAEELARVIGRVHRALEGLPPVTVWARVMYPSNLFFMDSLAKNADVMALDLDNLSRLMLGGTENGEWMQDSMPALEAALEAAFRNRAGRFAAMSGDMVSTPGLLEFLVRRGTDIICANPPEAQTVKHIVASVERRMLLEQGRE